MCDGRWVECTCNRQVKGLYLWGLVEHHLTQDEDHRWSLLESSLYSPEVPHPLHSTHASQISKSCSCRLTFSRAVHAQPEVRTAACWAIGHVSVYKAPEGSDIFSKLVAMAQCDVHLPARRQALRAIRKLPKHCIQGASSDLLLGCMAVRAPTAAPVRRRCPALWIAGSEASCTLRSRALCRVSGGVAGRDPVEGAFCSHKRVDQPCDLWY
jgi:hypothetical protein